MADATSLELTPAHVPSAKAVSAFEKLSSRISQELVRSRKHWDAHEPRMYSRVADIPDAQFAQLGDLVAVRAGQTAYGTIIFGKIKLTCADDAYIHVRIHDPPDEKKSEQDVLFHSLYTEEGDRDADGRPTSFRAIMTEADPIEFFSE